MGFALQSSLHGGMASVGRCARNTGLFIGLYCGAAKSNQVGMVKLAGMSNIKIAIFVSSAIWAAWAFARIV
jgi:hypothetical protein